MYMYLYSQRGDTWNIQLVNTKNEGIPSWSLFCPLLDLMPSAMTCTSGQVNDQFEDIPVDFSLSGAQTESAEVPSLKTMWPSEKDELDVFGSG